MPPELTLPDGRRLTVRRATPDDREAVAAFFDAPANTSLDARRLAATLAATLRQRTRLVTSGPDHGALVAAARGTDGLVGVAAWDHVPAQESCELLLVVADAWQGLGLGAALLEALVHDARDRGFRRFHTGMAGSNARMLGLLRERVAPLHTRIEGGFTRVDFEVPG